MTGSLPRSVRLALGALLLGSGVNLAAGARRPLVERAILSADHYPAAAAAARAFERHAPANSPLELVVYDEDHLGELDCAVWADYRFKWLLYPRKVEVLRWAAGSEPHPDPRYTDLGVFPPRIPQAPCYRIFFRVTASPQPAPGASEVLATGPHFILARGPGSASGMGIGRPIPRGRGDRR